MSFGQAAATSEEDLNHLLLSNNRTIYGNEGGRKLSCSMFLLLSRLQWLSSALSVCIVQIYEFLFYSMKSVH